MAKSRRVGVLRIGSIGDHLIALPVYRALRDFHPTDSLTLISNIPASGNPKLVGPANILPPGLFDDLRAYPALSGWRNVAAVLRLFRSLRLDRLYYLMPKRTRAQYRRDLLSRRFLAREVLGLNVAAVEAVRRVDGTVLYEHEADRLARAVGLPAGKANRAPERLSLELSAEERATASRTVEQGEGPAIVVSVGTKCDVKHWGRDNWKRLIRGLGELPALERLYFVGSADEYAECNELRAAWPREAVNACGKLSPRESAALIAAAHLFVGHDSGPMHLAAAVGVPIVAIFSSRSMPGVWYPLSTRVRTHYTMIDCMGCGRERCEDRQKACIRAISVEEVFTSCRVLLEQSQLEPAAEAGFG